MSETSQPPEEQARQIIRTWLTTQHRSLRNLAHEAGLQPSVISRFLNAETLLEVSSALKLYSVMQQSMNPEERRCFIDATGLLPLASAFSRDALFTVNLKAPAFEVGSCYFATGIATYHRAAFAEAIPLFREAEQILGQSASLAAYAGCMIAQLFLNLGDLHKAQEEAKRVHTLYAAVMDPKTQSELYRIRNWVDYYQGHYSDAERWLREVVRIGEEGGLPQQTSLHFLGRAYYDVGCHSGTRQEATRLFQQALVYFDHSYKLNRRFGTESNQAFELFRKAQVLYRLGNGQDATRLRVRARQMFQDGSVAGSIAVLNIDLEEMRLLLEEGHTARVGPKTEDVLQGWAQWKYPKGIGDSLKILGDLAYVNGDLPQALELFTARLCIYPYDAYPSSRQVWDEVKQLRRELIRQEGRKGYHALLHRLDDLAKHRQGYFSYLNQIVPDRSADVTRVLRSLRSL